MTPARWRLSRLASALVLQVAALGIANATSPTVPSFLARHDYPLLFTRKVAVADTNGDGIPDVIAGFGGTVTVLFGNGNGTFRQGPSSNLDMLNGWYFAVADLNGDGIVDLVVPGSWEVRSPPSGIGVCLGNGDGTFQPAVHYVAGNDTGLSYVVIGDFNGDGIPDAATVGYQGVWLFLGRGSGIFSPGVLTPLNDLSDAVLTLAAADFDGDGNLDLVVAQNNGFAVLLGNGDGTFQPAVTYPMSSGPHQLVVGDIDKNGYPDILAASAIQDQVSVFLGNGSGAFVGPTYIYLPGPGSIAVADVNGDGIPDLLNSSVYIRLGEGKGTFKAPVYYRVQSDAAGGSGSNNVVPAALTSNGLTDLVVQGAANVVSVLLNEGKGKYEDGVWTKVPNGAGCSAPGDYNGDGRPDLAVTDVGAIAILLGTGKAGVPFTAGTTFPVAYPGCPVAGDLNGDGILDLVVPVYYPPPATGGAVLAYLGNGDGTFTLKSTTPIPTFDYYLVLADFNNDGILDFASSGNSLALGNGDGTFQTPTPFIQNFPYCQLTGIASGDLNNDGWADLTVSCYSTNTIYIMLNNQSGGFTLNTVQTGSETPPSGIVLSDLNLDGNLDAVIPVALNGGVLVYLGNGQGGLTFEESFKDSIGVGPITVADINGDGFPDIAYGEEGTMAIFLGIGNGTFESPYYLGTGPEPTYLLTQNLHGQSSSAGVPDIVAPDGSGGVMVLINHTKIDATKRSTANAWPIW